MNIIDNLVPLNTPGNRRPGIRRAVAFIVVHNTCNPASTAQQERAWLTNPTNDRTASFNYVVDWCCIIRCIPDLEVTWNATDGPNGQGNVHGLAIEICESGDYKGGEANAIWLIATKMMEYNLPMIAIKPHQFFFPSKPCPHIILPYWADFIARVQTKYNELSRPYNNITPLGRRFFA